MSKVQNNVTPKIPERFIWATQLLNLEPNYRVLEIGCGTGLLAEQICTHFLIGEYTGIDQSAAMIQKALKRNQRFLETGLASFLISDFNKVRLPEFYYDVILAFNVNFFWQNAIPELQIIKKALKATGKLYVFYQGPYEIEESFMFPLRQKLHENNFEVLNTEKKKLTPTSAIYLIAQPT